METLLKIFILFVILFSAVSLVSNIIVFDLIGIILNVFNLTIYTVLLTLIEW